MWEVKMWKKFPLICSRIYVSRDSTDMQPTADVFLSGCIYVCRDATMQRSAGNIEQLSHWRQSQRNLLATNWPSVVHWLHQRQSRRDDAATLRNSCTFVSRDSTRLQRGSDALFDCCMHVSRDLTMQQLISNIAHLLYIRPSRHNAFGTEQRRVVQWLHTYQSRRNCIAT
jgi:hypothetical protein